MPLTITNLNDSTAAARSFTLLGRDRTSSEWLESHAGRETRLTVKTQVIGVGKAKNTNNSVKVRRTLINMVTTVPGFTDGGTAIYPEQTATVNSTLTAPENGELVNPNFTLDVKQDLGAYLESFLSNGVIEQLARGEV